ncbi:glycerol dehydratase reactivase beta/small subunit family protein [Halomarina halobia]|uniref:Glycerol dehydratase reactivase beta/small subunit family protein n=1 Tax=Halomarina halobia TaxID=3033386 RepID=A0ABD6AD19_9EURY|nr:glycerol dehydratase reactivase beta/small subunit family protein [Halomarina sp. PSR21]
MTHAPDAPPAVCLVATPDCGALPQRVEYGLEEESVPVRVAEAAFDDPVAAAFEAAADSRLGIGVALSPARGVLHHERLARSEPLLAVDRPSPADARRLGTNAGRLAKRLPLRL